MKPNHYRNFIKMHMEQVTKYEVWNNENDIYIYNTIYHNGSFFLVNDNILKIHMK